MLAHRITNLQKLCNVIKLEDAKLADLKLIIRITIVIHAAHGNSIICLANDGIRRTNSFISYHCYDLSRLQNSHPIVIRKSSTRGDDPSKNRLRKVRTKIFVRFYFSKLIFTYLSLISH